MMSNKPLFENQSYYEVPLLRLLYTLPNGEGKVADVVRRFDEAYGDQIPPKDYEELESGQIRWKNLVNWCRYSLKKHGYIDGSTYGVWRITGEGRRWVEENPDADLLPTLQRSKSGSKTQRSRKKNTTHVSFALPGVTLEMLEQTRQSMPADQFRQVWGQIYDQLLAAERAKAITQVSQTELGRRAQRKVDEIHSFLSGRHSAIPRSEIICDWIYFCYELELYREAASLLQYVRDDEIDSNVYRRAKRCADASRVKLGW
jgi:hypothetical protein